MSAGTDEELAIDLLVSLLLSRLVLTGQPVDDAYLDRLTSVIVAGIVNAHA